MYSQLLKIMQWFEGILLNTADCISLQLQLSQLTQPAEGSLGDGRDAVAVQGKASDGRKAEENTWRVGQCAGYLIVTQLPGNNIQAICVCLVKVSWGLTETWCKSELCWETQ